MATQIYVNLPVRNLDKSVEFFTALGFSFNPQFTDENATCMVISDTIYVMLLVEPFFKSFTKKDICDTARATESIMCLSAENKEHVDDLVNRALKAGGKVPNEKNDQGWMYGWGFEDIDGHLWEIVYMDESAIPQQNN